LDVAYRSNSVHRGALTAEPPFRVASASNSVGGDGRGTAQNASVPIDDAGVSPALMNATPIASARSGARPPSVEPSGHGQGQSKGALDLVAEEPQLTRNLAIGRPARKRRRW
jgi:hypothetical protein